MAASLALVLPDYKLFQENKIYQVSKNFIDKAIFPPLRKQMKACHFNAGVGDHYLMNHVGINRNLGKKYRGRTGNWEDLQSVW